MDDNTSQVPVNPSTDVSTDLQSTEIDMPEDQVMEPAVPAMQSPMIGGVGSGSASNDGSVMSVKPNWIEVKDGKFVCSECENESAPETNTAEGVVTANLDEIKSKFVSNPGKSLTIYGICPVCGMEYEFRHLDGNLYLEPSAMVK
jgi:hypothetical protein